MILITGGTGIVGSHLLFELASAGKNLRAIKRHSSRVDTVKRIFNYYSPNGDSLFQNIEWVDADLLDIPGIDSAMEDVEDVYHCAAMVSYNPTKSNQMGFVNIHGTANLVNCALSKKVKKFCHVSSIAVLGSEYNEKNVSEQNYINEKPGQGTLHHNSAYALSKLAAEREVWRASAEGLNVVIVNPGIIVGPGNWGKSSTSLLTNVWRGLKYYPPGVNGFIDARDVARIMVQLMEKNCFNERFILVAENLPYKEVIWQIADSLGKKRPGIAVNKFYLELFWRFERIRSWLFNTRPLMTSDLAKPAYQKLYYSNEKIKKIIGWEFIPIKESIPSACRAFLDWNKEKGEKVEMGAD